MGPKKLINIYERIPKRFFPNSHNPHYEQHKIKIPFRAMVVGASGSGKTALVMSVFLNCMPDTWHKIVIITKNSDEPIYQYIKTIIPQQQLEILEGIESIPALDSFSKNENNLVIFDDLMLDDMKQIGQYFIRARKLGVSCLFLVQSFFSNDKNFKLIRRNINYLFLKKVAGLKDITYIMREYSLDINKKDFVKLYQDATKNFTDFLLIDIDAPPEERFRINFDVVDVSKMKESK